MDLCSGHPGRKELETHVTLEGLEPYVLRSPEPIDAFSPLADPIEMTLMHIPPLTGGHMCINK